MIFILLLSVAVSEAVNSAGRRYIWLHRDDRYQGNIISSSC